MVPARSFAYLPPVSNVIYRIKRVLYLCIKYVTLVGNQLHIFLQMSKNLNKTNTLVPLNDSDDSFLESDGDSDFYLKPVLSSNQSTESKDEVDESLEGDARKKQKKKVHDWREIKNEDSTRGIPV